MFKEIIKDGHMHSHYCPHGSKDSFDMYIENAIILGLKEITFTEHMCLPESFIDPSPLKDSAMSEKDVEKYFDEINRNKQKYKHLIKINAGFEVDYLEGFEDETIKLLNKYGEYIEDSIISTHMLNIENEYHLVDFSPELFLVLIEKLGNIENVYSKYYKTIENMVNVDLGEFKPKRIGHINLVRKFQKTFPYDYSSHKEQIENIMKIAKKKNMELDYNVSGLRKNLCGEIYVDGIALELAQKYEIPLVFGSDSHVAEDVGKITTKDSSEC